MPPILSPLTHVLLACWWPQRVTTGARIYRTNWLPADDKLIPAVGLVQDRGPKGRTRPGRIVTPLVVHGEADGAELLGSVRVPQPPHIGVMHAQRLRRDRLRRI